MMKTLISQFVTTGRCYGFESDWAKRQVTIGIDIRHDFGPEEAPIGEVRMRRLLLGQYRVRFGEYGTAYRGSSPTSLWINGRHPNFDAADAEREYWVNRFLWDGLRPVEQSWGDRRDAYIPGTFLSNGSDQGEGTARADMSFVFFEYTGEDPSGMNVDAMWKTSAVLRKDVRYRLNPSRIVAADSSLTFEDEVESAFAARLGVEYEQGRDRWVPVVTIIKRPGVDPFMDDIVFGGNLAIVAVDPSQAEGRGTEYLRGRQETFWAWGQERYVEERHDQTDGVTPPQRSLSAGNALRVRSQFTSSLPGEMISNPWSLKRRNLAERKVVLRMTYQHHPRISRFAGLWGDRVFEGVLEFEIPGWTVEELRQLMVNGIVPDHAMP